MAGCSTPRSGSSGASQGGNDTCGRKTYQRGRFTPSTPALRCGLTPEDPRATLRRSWVAGEAFVQHRPRRSLRSHPCSTAPNRRRVPEVERSGPPSKGIDLHGVDPVKMCRSRPVQQFISRPVNICPKGLALRRCASGGTCQSIRRSLSRGARPSPCAVPSKRLQSAAIPPSPQQHWSTRSLDPEVGLAGIEPATSALSVLRSNRLSYSPGESATLLQSPDALRSPRPL